MRAAITWLKQQRLLLRAEARMVAPTTLNLCTNPTALTLTLNLT